MDRIQIQTYDKDDNELFWEVYDLAALRYIYSGDWLPCGGWGTRWAHSTREGMIKWAILERAIGDKQCYSKYTLVRHNVAVKRRCFVWSQESIEDLINWWKE